MNVEKPNERAAGRPVLTTMEKGLSFPTFRLDNKICMVTGGAQGIGRAVALGFANVGGTVVVADANPEKLPEMDAELKQLGRSGLTLTMDVRDQSAIQRAFDRVVSEYGRIDVLVNNAAIRRNSDAIDTTLEDWEYVLSVNTTGVFLCAQAAARAMKNTGGGSIINIASNNAMLVEPRQLAYCVSKAAVAHMTRCMALEWAPYGIRVNSVAPGMTLTPYVKSTLKGSGVQAGLQGSYTEKVAMGRAADPDEQIGAFIYLASDAASYATGGMIVVDGGRSVKG